MAQDTKYRLITRSDMDGIVCAALLREAGVIDSVQFAHPKDMQDGLIGVGHNDIIANLPYNESAHLVFDHHRSEDARVGSKPNFINNPDAPSAARVIYDHYGGAATFPNISQELLDATSKIDAAQVTKEEILNPQGWVMLGFIMDNRTGLGRFRHFRVSNYQLMMDMIDYLRKYKDPEDILKLPDVAERVKMYKDHAELALAQIQRCAQIRDNLLLLDFRNEPEVYVINRFAIYAIFPNANISMHVMWGRERRNTVFAVGKSVLNRTAKVDVGALMLEYGGGGHKAVGTCQVENAVADKVMAELIEKITAAG